MTPSTIFGAFVAAAPVIQGGVLAAQPPVSLSLEITATNVIDRHLLITVRNTGTQPITAWGVRGSVTFEGGRTQPVLCINDGYANAFADPLARERPFVRFTPGTTLTGRSGVVLPDTAMLSAALVPHLVVLADGTALGDEPLIQMLFANRARERKAAHLIDDVLGRYLGTVADPAAAVTLIDRELQDLADAEVRETPHYRNFRHNLSVAMKEAHASTHKRSERFHLSDHQTPEPSEGESILAHRWGHSQDPAIVAAPYRETRLTARFRHRSFCSSSLCLLHLEVADALAIALNPQQPFQMLIRWMRAGGYRIEVGVPHGSRTEGTRVIR